MEFEIEVPGTPEQVWEAIATGPGISAWFIPAEVDDEKVTFNYAPGMSGSAPIIASDQPNRLAFDDGAAGATEFLVEAKSGGTCVVRVVVANFSADAVDGWKAALQGLRLYLGHFAPQHASTIIAGGVVPGPADRAWPALLEALGMDEPAVGERFETRNGPPLAGTVEFRTATSATLRLTEPVNGLGFVGTGGPQEDEVFSFLRMQLFGDEREEIVARDEPGWRDLLPSGARTS